MHDAILETTPAPLGLHSKKNDSVSSIKIRGTSSRQERSTTHTNGFLGNLVGKLLFFGGTPQGRKCIKSNREKLLRRGKRVH